MSGTQPEGRASACWGISASLQRVDDSHEDRFPPQLPLSKFMFSSHACRGHILDGGAIDVLLPAGLLWR